MSTAGSEQKSSSAARLNFEIQRGTVTDTSGKWTGIRRTDWVSSSHIYVCLEQSPPTQFGWKRRLHRRFCTRPTPAAQHICLFIASAVLVKSNSSRPSLSLFFSLRSFCLLTLFSVCYVFRCPFLPRFVCPIANVAVLLTWGTSILWIMTTYGPLVDHCQRQSSIEPITRHLLQKFEDEESPAIPMGLDRFNANSVSHHRRILLHDKSISTLLGYCIQLLHLCLKPS